MPTTYEFVVEQMESCNDDADIIDTSGFDRMDEAIEFRNQCNEWPTRICLRRDTGNDLEGITERYYAYASNGVLQDRFESCMGAQDGPPVPKRFLKMDWSDAACR